MIEPLSVMKVIDENRLVDVFLGKKSKIQKSQLQTLTWMQKILLKKQMQDTLILQIIYQKVQGSTKANEKWEARNISRYKGEKNISRTYTTNFLKSPFGTTLAQQLYLLPRTIRPQP